MHGNAELTVGLSTVNVDFEVKETVKKGERGNMKVVVITKPAHFDGDADDHDKKKNGHKKNDNCEHERQVKAGDTRDVFKSDDIGSIQFSDDPAFRPGSRKKEPTMDFVDVTGTGTWNGASGYTFSASASDRGEPGKNLDTFAITVKNSVGAVVAAFNGTLSGGNIQSRRLAGRN